MISNKDKNTKLLIRPEPFPDESLVGYINRLSELNGYPNSSYLWNAITAPKTLRSSVKSNKLNTNEQINKLSQLVDKSSAEIKEIARVHLSANYLRFFGKPLKTKLLLSWGGRVCPECLAEKNYHQSIWDIVINTTCPFHKRLLIYKCYKCRKTLKSKRKLFYKCDCGNDLRKSPSQWIRKDEIRVSGHLVNQLFDNKLSHRFLEKENLLINYNVSVFVESIFYFAKRIHFIETKKIINNFVHQPTFHKSICKALKLFDNYPTNFDKFINKLITSDLYYLTGTENKHFHFLLPNFYTQASPEFLSVIYYQFVNRILERVDLEGKARKEGIRRKYLTPKELSDQLNVEIEALEVIGRVFNLLHIELQGESLFEGSSFLQVMNIFRSRMTELPNTSDEVLMNIAQVRNYLNYDEGKFSEFILTVFDGNIIPCKEDFSAKGLQRFLFSKSDLEKI